MEVVMATLADSANTTSDGKLNLMGLFDTVYARTLPVVHPSMQLVLRIRAAPAETDREHHLEIRLMDADGGQLFKVEGDMSMKAPPGEPAIFNHIVGINNLTFQKYGGYTFSVFINRDLKHTLLLDLKEAPSQDSS